MRTLVIIVIAMLVPFTMWIAGCRQNERQAAAFPKGPEVKNLAGTPERPVRRSQPVIPAAIDPEVAMTPDQPTFAVLRSVMDREAAIASRHGDDTGLFVLPRQDFPELVNGHAEPAGQAMAGASFEGREFWSVPAAPVMTARPTGFDIPDDVSAMAPPGGIPGLFMPEPILPFEFIPGVFMGGAVEHFDAPTMSALSGEADVRLQDQARIVPPTAFLEPPSASELSLESLRLNASELGYAPEKTDRPAKTEVERRLTALSDAPAPAISRFSGAARSTDIREALAPLPNLVAMSATAEKAHAPEQPLALPIPPPLDSTRAASPASASGRTAFVPNAPPSLMDSVSGRLDRDMHMMNSRKSAGARPEEFPVPKSFAEIGKASGEAETESDASRKAGNPSASAIEPTGASAIEPTGAKLVLKPIGEHESHARASSLYRIDAMMDAPPIMD